MGAGKATIWKSNGRILVGFGFNLSVFNFFLRHLRNSTYNVSVIRSNLVYFDTLFSLRLTQRKNYQMRLQMVSPDGVFKEANHSYFRLLNDSTFPIHYESFESNPTWFVQDAFLKANLTQTGFSTKDMDNDLDERDCAKKGPGW